MRCAYFDCFSGAAGDMLLGALVDAGCHLDELRATLGRLGLPDIELSAEIVTREGLRATQVRVVAPARSREHHRHLADIAEIVTRAGLPTRVTDRVLATFRRLAEAEAAVHGIAPEKVHFHEVGAADAIADIVGVCTAVELLGLQRLMCSPIPTGYGTVECEHGVLPVPAPAVVQLLVGVPLAECDVRAELTTPTGAALLTTLCDRFGPPPAMVLERVGCGAGTRELPGRPNVLRVLIGELQEHSAECDQVTVLEAQVDDSTGQSLGYACEQLLAAGALDAYVVPIIMKKGRPGQLLTVLCRPEDVPRIEGVIFRETTTFGIRRHDATRSKLSRQTATVQTRFGPVRVKVGRRADQVVQAWPEYEDCAAAAQRAGVALRTVQQDALRVWAENYGT